MTETMQKLNSQLSHKKVEKPGVIIDYVDLKRLPQFGILSHQVSTIIQSASWWESYGVDLCIHILGLAGWLGSHWLLASSNTLLFIGGIVMLGYSFAVITIKAAHMALHDACFFSRIWNRIMSLLCVDAVGTFSADVGYKIHIKMHHPHTNIIGLGDSSTWRAPYVPRFFYMFFTPLLVPFMTPMVAHKEILTEPIWKIARYVTLAYSGLGFHLYLLMTVSQLSFPMALLVAYLGRGMLSIPYIHVNLFQHIGLPMYSPKHRPKRLYQMTTGALNLPRNPILDYSFGHGIISCHVEHHLFPKLSDNMCLKIKPIVRRFCQEHDLPYHEDSYSGRVWYFLTNYNQLMVDVPPITKFVGLQ